MKDLPHQYQARARGAAEGEVTLSSANLPDLASDSPAEFGGSGERWSPETLLCAAVGDCIVLTFRVVARMSKLPFTDLTCEVEGLLEKVERTIRFTSFVARVRLTIPPGTDVAKARAVLEKAEHACLISRSLAGPVTLEAEVLTEA